MTGHHIISKTSGDITLEELLELLDDSVKNDTYFEIGPRAARVLREAFIFASVHNGNLAAALAHSNEGGICRVCGVRWPCETAQAFLRKPQS